MPRRNKRHDNFKLCNNYQLSNENILSRGCLVYIGIMLFHILTTPGVKSEKAADIYGFQPTFGHPAVNVTVTVGKNASLNCVIDHLGKHKVAWIHSDSSSIVAINTHIIAKIRRFSVTYDTYNTWTLHVREVSQNDSGWYMCQVNTYPMIAQRAYLDVKAPPNIIDTSSSSSPILVSEKDDVELVCHAEGNPKPAITWRREDGRSVLRTNTKLYQVYEGSRLRLSQINRDQSGTYMCIAYNGVPPSVSKRITVQVQFSPRIYVPNQFITATTTSLVRLECEIESAPPPLIYWTHNNDLIVNNSRIFIEIAVNGFKYLTVLFIRNVQETDFGEYVCFAKNSFSETNGVIKLIRTYENGTMSDVEQPRSGKGLLKPTMPGTSVQSIIEIVSSVEESSKSSVPEEPSDLTVKPTNMWFNDTSDDSMPSPEILIGGPVLTSDVTAAAATSFQMRLSAPLAILIAYVLR